MKRILVITIFWNESGSFPFISEVSTDKLFLVFSMKWTVGAFLFRNGFICVECNVYKAFYALGIISNLKTISVNAHVLQDLAYGSLTSPTRRKTD